MTFWLWLSAGASCIFCWVCVSDRLIPRRLIEEARQEMEALEHVNAKFSQQVDLLTDHLTSKDGGGGIAVIGVAEARPLYGWPNPPLTHSQYAEQHGVPHIHLPEPVVLNTGELVNWVCSECVQPCDPPELDALARSVLRTDHLLWNRDLDGGPVRTFEGTVLEVSR